MDRYVPARQRVSLDKHLVHEAPTYWHRLPSAGLATLGRAAEQTRYTAVRVLGAWLRCYWGVDYSRAG